MGDTFVICSHKSHCAAFSFSLSHSFKFCSGSNFWICSTNRKKCICKSFLWSCIEGLNYGQRFQQTQMSFSRPALGLLPELYQRSSQTQWSYFLPTEPQILNFCLFLSWYNYCASVDFLRTWCEAARIKSATVHSRPWSKGEKA